MDDELHRLEIQIGECGLDFMGWSEQAAKLRFSATFVPVMAHGEQTLCLGAWQGVSLALSDDDRLRAVAAIIYCEWAHEAARSLGADA